MLDSLPFDLAELYAAFAPQFELWLQTHATAQNAAVLLFGALTYAVGARALLFGAAALLLCALIEFYSLAAVPAWVAPVTLLVLAFGFVQLVVMAFLGTDTGGNFLSSVLIAALVLILLAPWRVLSKLVQWGKK